MRWPQRCRTLTALRIADPAADRDRRRQDGRTVQVHVRATARTNGGASAPVTTPGTCSKPTKSIRVRNAGEDLLPRPGSAQRSSALGWTTARVPSRKRHAGCPHPNHAGAAGAGFRPVVPHAPTGKGTKRRPASPAPAQSGGRFRTSVAGADFVWREPGKPGARCRTTHGAMTRVGSPDKRSAIRGLSQPRMSLRSCGLRAGLFDN